MQMTKVNQYENASASRRALGRIGVFHHRIAETITLHSLLRKTASRRSVALSVKRLCSLYGILPGCPRFDEAYPMMT
jgi:hypothetical protein